MPRVAGKIAWMAVPVSRVLCDARTLNIFEGAAEIQAQVVCRALSEDRN